MTREKRIRDFLELMIGTGIGLITSRLLDDVARQIAAFSEQNDPDVIAKREEALTASKAGKIKPWSEVKKNLVIEEQPTEGELALCPEYISHRTFHEGASFDTDYKVIEKCEFNCPRCLWELATKVQLAHGKARMVALRLSLKNSNYICGVCGASTGEE